MWRCWWECRRWDHHHGEVAVSFSGSIAVCSPGVCGGQPGVGGAGFSLQHFAAGRREHRLLRYLYGSHLVAVDNVSCPPVSPTNSSKDHFHTTFCACAVPHGRYNDKRDRRRGNVSGYFLWAYDRAFKFGKTRGELNSTASYKVHFRPLLTSTGARGVVVWGVLSSSPRYSRCIERPKDQRGRGDPHRRLAGKINSFTSVAVQLSPTQNLEADNKLF